MSDGDTITAISGGILAAGSLDDRLWNAIIWFGVILAASLLIVVVFLGVRRWFVQGERDDFGGALSLDEVARLHREGAISEEEFRALRQSVIQGMTGRGRG